jgi:hypothetical protein
MFMLLFVLMLLIGRSRVLSVLRLGIASACVAGTQVWLRERGERDAESRVVNAARLRQFQRAPELFLGQGRSILRMAAAMKPAPDFGYCLEIVVTIAAVRGSGIGPGNAACWRDNAIPKDSLVSAASVCVAWMNSASEHRQPIEIICVERKSRPPSSPAFRLRA